ncbi:MAG: hypothetical protein P3W93_009470 [Thermus sp.]|nr:hypothetical protein [Thermus sp.]
MRPRPLVYTLLVFLVPALAAKPLDKGLVIADAGNHRLVELSGEGRLVRIVPLPRPFRYTDDVFLDPKWWTGGLREGCWSWT